MDAPHTTSTNPRWTKGWEEEYTEEEGVIWVNAAGLKDGDHVRACGSFPRDPKCGHWGKGYILDGSKEERTVAYLRSTRPNMWFKIEKRMEEVNEFGPVSP